ncbi:MAG: formylglycine-generating enzyme family protein, partial [Pseudobdellovibrionaceae bacterium]
MNSGETALADLIPDHKKGDVYRLPTEAEWEFVVRGRGQYNETYHFGNEKSVLGDYAWYNENSEDQSHSVAEKKPLLIEGKEFYDMHGNVWEWVQDWYADSLPRGVDPQGPQRGDTRVIESFTLG